MKRRTTILSPTDLGSAGTEVIDIREKSQISCIAIRFAITIATVSVMTAPLRKTITKVEIVDGGRVLASYSGNASSGLNAWQRGKLPYTQLSLTATDLAYATVFLDFGRFLWDPEYALRPEMFSNPQLRITWDEDAANGSVVVNEFAVYGFVDDAPEDGGASAMLVTKEVQNYAMAASAHKYIDMPTDQPIRALFVQGDTIDHDIPVLYDHIRIDMNNGGMVIVDHDFTSLLEIADDFGPFEFPVTLDAVVTAKDLYVPTAFRNQLLINYDDTAFVDATSKFAVGAYKGQFCDMAASVTIQADTGVVTGYMPGGVLPFEFGDPARPATWLRPDLSDELRVDVTASSDADSGDTTTVLVQQDVRY